MRTVHFPIRGRGGNYVGRAFALLAFNLKTGGNPNITVAHDEWCDLLVRGGVCNCNPDFYEGTVAEAMRYRRKIVPREEGR